MTTLFFEISKTWDVSKTFPALEEVWRSVLDEDSVFRARVQSCFSIIIAAQGFPLARKGIKHRAAILRGAGNSVVCELAAEFILAVMESLWLIPKTVPHCIVNANTN